MDNEFPREQRARMVPSFGGIDQLLVQRVSGPVGGIVDYLQSLGSVGRSVRGSVGRSVDRPVGR